jgi:hypothetical protein
VSEGPRRKVPHRYGRSLAIGQKIRVAILVRKVVVGGASSWIIFARIALGATENEPDLG